MEGRPLSLADDLANLRPNHGGTPCGVAAALAEMDEADRDVFLAAIANPRLQGEGITRILRQHGYQIGNQSVSRHRRGVCSCL